jgi:hypothetical protein
LTVALAQQASAASLPPGLLQATLHAALSTATFGTTVAGAVSPFAADLAKGALKSMFIKKLCTGVAVVVTMGLLAVSAVCVGRATAEPRPALAQAAKGTQAPGAAFSEKEFNELQARLDVHNQPWASIPWQVSLTEARELAAKTNKPIFLAVGTGNPLGWG